MSSYLLFELNLARAMQGKPGREQDSTTIRWKLRKVKQFAQDNKLGLEPKSIKTPCLFAEVGEELPESELPPGLSLTAGLSLRVKEEPVG